MISLLLTLLIAAGPCDALGPQVQAAVKALEAQDWALAERVLQQFANDSAACPRVLVAKGRLQLGRRNVASAEKYSEMAMANGSGDAEVLIFRSQILALRGTLPEAQQLLEKAVTLEPENAEAHFQLGMVFDRARRNPEAVEAFQSVIRLRPSDPRAYDYLALNLEPMGEITMAEAAYKQGLLANKGTRFDAFLDYNYGKLLLKLNRLDEAKVHLDRALEVAPKVRAVRYDHAKLCLRLGKPEEAKLDAAAALSLPDPSGFILDLQVYNLLVTICTKLGDDELAMQYAKLAERTSVPIRSRDRK